MKIRNNAAIKAVAVILSVLLLLGTVFFGVCAVAAGAVGAYTGNFKKEKENVLQNILRSYAYEIADAYWQGNDIDKLYGGANFYYEIESSTGDKISHLGKASTYLQQTTVTYTQYVYENVSYTVNGDVSYTVGREITAPEVSYTVESEIDAPEVSYTVDEGMFAAAEPLPETVVSNTNSDVTYTVSGEESVSTVVYTVGGGLIENAEPLPLTESPDVTYTVDGEPVDTVQYGVSGEDMFIFDDATEPLSDNCEVIVTYNGELYSLGNVQNTDELQAILHDFGYYAESEPTPVTLTVTLYEKAAKYTTDKLSLARFWIDAVYSMRYVSISLAAGCFILLIAVWIFLFCAAGHRKKSSEPSLGLFDRIPFDLFTVLSVALFAAIGLGVVFLIELIMYQAPGTFSAQLTFAIAAGIGTAICAVVLYLILLGYLLSFAARVKVGGLIRSTLIYKAVAFICRGAYKLICALPLVWKTALLLFAVTLLELILLLSNAYEPDNLVILWTVEKIIVIPLVIFAVLLLRKLKKGGEAIAEGHIGEKIDTKYMPLDFGEFGETLNNIGGGLERAVDEKMKSERLKTELITNVSHDIKTPLTSIVNYVDLIKKEEIENEKVREYVDVLDRHSARLKKLIDDLVEASKASTGNLTVECERLDACVLLEQSLGEYSEKLEASELTPIMSMPSDPAYIMADGRRLWRVFDNLLCNICKYAMPKTRVYITLERADNKVTAIFRNISRESLNITGDELTERFVRGDASRNTEGSGLGLSIARSLTELQGGTLDVTIDGDLFKATVTFPAA
ncbi:MAG: HAMP domain-containing histidine kinase [Clostridia bacterium]|nr:HAMP domain-containing histidine kinase [Clostridia bacterium]